MKIDYTRYYLKWHSDTEGHRAAMIQLYRRLLADHLPPDKTERLLDVGCGMGFALLALKDFGYFNVTGVEADEGQVLSCRKKGLEVELTTDTVAFLAAHKNRYSAVLCLDVIEHVPVAMQLQFVAAIADSLADGGRLICSVPNANSAVAERWRYNDWTHSSSFTEHSLDFLLYNAGFNEINVFPMEFIEKPRLTWLPVGGARHWWAFKFFRLWRRLEMMAELGPDQGRKVPLSLNLMAVATKRSKK